MRYGAEYCRREYYFMVRTKRLCRLFVYDKRERNEREREVYKVNASQNNAYEQYSSVHYSDVFKQSYVYVVNAS